MDGDWDTRQGSQRSVKSVEQGPDRQRALHHCLQRQGKKPQYFLAQAGVRQLSRSGKHALDMADDPVGIKALVGELLPQPAAALLVGA